MMVFSRVVEERQGGGRAEVPALPSGACPSMKDISNKYAKPCLLGSVM